MNNPSQGHALALSRPLASLLGALAIACGEPTAEDRLHSLQPPSEAAHATITSADMTTDPDGDYPLESPCADTLRIRRRAAVFESNSPVLRVTAGHGSCGARSDAVFRRLEGSVDGALVDAGDDDEDSFVTLPNGNVLLVTGAADVASGATICTSGGVGGSRCGVVLNKTTAPTYAANSFGFYMVDVGCQGGDSGAPWFVDNGNGTATAVGITSGVRVTGGVRQCMISSLTDLLTVATGGQAATVGFSPCTEAPPQNNDPQPWEGIWQFQPGAPRSGTVEFRPSDKKSLGDLMGDMVGSPKICSDTSFEYLLSDAAGSFCGRYWAGSTLHAGRCGNLWESIGVTIGPGLMNVSDPNDAPSSYQLRKIDTPARGHLDACDAQICTGWARDPDTAKPIAVHFYTSTDREDFTFAGGVMANQSSEAGVGGSGVHRFTWRHGLSGRHVRAFAIGVDAQGAASGRNPALSSDRAIP